MPQFDLKTCPSNLDTHPSDPSYLFDLWRRQRGDGLLLCPADDVVSGAASVILVGRSAALGPGTEELDGRVATHAVLRGLALVGGGVQSAQLHLCGGETMAWMVSQRDRQMG